MSLEYDNYLMQHRNGVNKSLEWLQKNCSYLFENVEFNALEIQLSHDKSKNDPEEYEAYDAYFYGGNRSYQVVQDFKRAWLHHIHHNPHHWQYWILINDDDGIECIEMPMQYVIEMICDWWSFSWNCGNLYKIFDWYDKHKDQIKLHDDTLYAVESILEDIKNKLDAERDKDEF